MIGRARGTDVVVVIAWMCGALFAVWLAFKATLTAQAVVQMGPVPWTAFLDRIPWYGTWLGLAVLLAAAALVAASLARRVHWVAYIYAAGVVALMALLYWAAVAVPTNSVLANPV